MKERHTEHSTTRLAVQNMQCIKVDEQIYSRVPQERFLTYKEEFRPVTKRVCEEDHNHDEVCHDVTTVRIQP